MSALLQFDDVVKTFPVTRGAVFRHAVGEVRAVDGVSLEIGEGETLGLVGESGSGKSTMARLVLRLVEPTSGRISFAGRDVGSLDRRGLRAHRREIGIVFQDPYGSLDPRMSVERLIAEPMLFHRVVRRSEAPGRVRELLELVQLDPDAAGRLPHQFSGGQQQRIAIARALASNPRLLLLDEPVSALDVTVRGQILDLLRGLQTRLRLSYLFITHDLSLVGRVCRRVAVMHRGRIVETGPSAEVFARPGHPYTRSLLAAVPVPDPSEERRRRRERLRAKGPLGATATKGADA